jgi:hypothetical protein
MVQRLGQEGWLTQHSFDLARTKGWLQSHPFFIDDL